MYVAARPRREPEGLGLPWFIPIIAAVAGTVGSAAASRLISGPSSPSQKDIEEQIKLQHQLEIQRMFEQQRIQQQQVQQLSSVALPALALIGLVMILR